MEARLPAVPLLAGTRVFWQVGKGGRGGGRELGLSSGNMDGNLVPCTRVLELGDELEAVGDVEGPPSLVAIGAGGTGVTRLAAVAQRPASKRRRRSS